MKKIILFFIFVVGMLSAKEYELGEGYQLGNTPAYVGGYFSLEYSNYSKGNLQKVSLNNMALLSYGSYSKFSYMAEMEFKNYYTKIYDNGQKITIKDTKLYAERLYGDYTANENFMARLGKYNSNVGYWNLTPINVLRDTTSSPVTAEIVFPKYTTGIDLRYHLFTQIDEVTLNITLQDNNSLDEEYNNFYIKKHFSLGLEYSYENLSVKLNGGYFHKKDHTQVYVDNYYGYLSFLYDNDTLKVMGGLGHREDNRKEAVKLSTYLQTTYEIASHHYPVVRLEHYNSQIDIEDGITKDTSAIIGYAYRPTYPVAFKVEYQLHSNKQLDRFLTSFSVMF